MRLIEYEKRFFVLEAPALKEMKEGSGIAGFLKNKKKYFPFVLFFFLFSCQSLKDHKKSFQPRLSSEALGVLENKRGDSPLVQEIPAFAGMTAEAGVTAGTGMTELERRTAERAGMTAGGKKEAQKQSASTQSSQLQSVLRTQKRQHWLSKQKPSVKEAPTRFLKRKFILRAQESQKSPVIDKDYLDFSASSAYLKAETAFLEKDTQSALDYLKTAQIFSSPSDRAYLIERKADFYKTEGLLTEALQNYKKWIKKYGEDSRIQKKIMECYVLNELNDLALQENEKLLKKEPESFLLGFQKSILLIGQRRWDESLKALQGLLFQNRSLEELSQALAFQSYVLSELDREEEALKSYRQLLGLDFPEELNHLIHLTHNIPLFFSGF